jgi:monoamine oxidase
VVARTPLLSIFGVSDEKFHIRGGNQQLPEAYPNLSWTGRATHSLPHRSPFFELSYSFYRVGQYTDFGGYEPQRESGVFFCGEHTTQEFQSCMEGGAITGKQAALDLIARIG